MKNTIVEMCPHCEREIEMQWDTENDGYKAFCPNCGNTLMLCDECMHEGDGCDCNTCDWNEKTGCKRYKKEPNEEGIVLCVDLDGTIANFDNSATPEQLLESEFFYTREPQMKLINNINYLRKKRVVEVFVLSAYLTDNEYPLRDKNRWCDTWFNVDKEHRIFVPNAQNKATYFEKATGRKIDKRFIMLEDYTPALKNFQAAGGSTIKFMNGVNGNNGTYRGVKLCRDDVEKHPYALTAAIEFELGL